MGAGLKKLLFDICVVLAPDLTGNAENDSSYQQRVRRIRDACRAALEGEGDAE